MVALWLGLGIALVGSVKAGEAPAGVQRTELQRVDVPGSDYVVITAVTLLDPGAVIALHAHPGVEMGYVIEGTVTVSIKGQPDHQYQSGDSFQIPAGAPHGAINKGTEPLRIVSTFVVEKNKPLRSEPK